MRRTVKSIIFGIIGLIILEIAPSQAMPAASRITLPTGKKIFVSGMNLAWINYAQDVVSFDSTKMAQAIKSVRDSGGNTMRIWLSTNGTRDPVFGTDGYVSGPNATTIASIQKMLKIAKNNTMLLCLTLLTHNFMQNQGASLDNNRKLLQTDTGITAYLNNYITPVVKAIGLDPNLLCWEVFNEPEGMVENIGWTDNRITQINVQKVVNRVAGAIHKAVPGVLVSNGAVTMGYCSATSGSNWYSDDNLLAVGGDSAGYLDFYMAHYYGWNGISVSPFTKTFAYWNLDKPLVIGEFPAGSWSPSISSKNQDAAAIDTLFDHLYTTGYAGGMSWSYYGDQTDTWLGSFATTSPWLAKLYQKDSSSISLSGVFDNKFTVSVSGGNGGAVTTSKLGRIASGALDTLTAMPLAGYTFSGWSGDTTATDPILIISITRDRSISATFVPDAGTNMLKNGTFTEGSANWGFYAAAGNTATVLYTAGYAAVSIPQADTFNYHIQLTQGSISLVTGATYQLTFSAWSSGTRDLTAGISTEGTWLWQGGSTVSLTATKTQYSIDITANTTATTGILQFNVGKSMLGVNIDDVSLVKKQTAIKYQNFAPTANSPQTLIRVSASKLEWARSAPLKNAGILRLVSASGREVACAKIVAGARFSSMNLATVKSGAYFVVLEGQGLREMSALTIVR